MMKRTNAAMPAEKNLAAYTRALLIGRRYHSRVCATTLEDLPARHVLRLPPHPALTATSTPRSQWNSGRPEPRHKPLCGTPCLSTLGAVWNGIRLSAIQSSASFSHFARSRASGTASAFRLHSSDRSRHRSAFGMALTHATGRLHRPHPRTIGQSSLGPCGQPSLQLLRGRAKAMTRIYHLGFSADDRAATLTEAPHGRQRNKSTTRSGHRHTRPA